MTDNQRFALGLFGCGLIFADLFLCSKGHPIGILFGLIGGALAGWNGMALWMKGHR